MANKLTKKQRDFLDKQPKGLISWDNMESQDFEHMMKLSNHETLLSDIDRYLWDKETEARYGNCYFCGRSEHSVDLEQHLTKRKLVCVDIDECEMEIDANKFYGELDSVEDTPCLDEPWWKNP